MHSLLIRFRNVGRRSIVQYRVFLGIWGLLVPLINLTAETYGREFSSSLGYKITCPDGWHLVTPKQLSQLAVRGIHADMIINGPHWEKYASHVEILVMDGMLPVNENVVAKIAEAKRAEFAGGGKTISKMKSRQIRIGDRAAISIAYELEQPNVDKVLACWSVFLREAGKPTLFNA